MDTPSNCPHCGAEKVSPLSDSYLCWSVWICGKLIRTIHCTNADATQIIGTAISETEVLIGIPPNGRTYIAGEQIGKPGETGIPDADEPTVIVKESE